MLTHSATGTHPTPTLNYNYELFRVMAYDDQANTVTESLSRSPADEDTLVNNYDNSHWIENVTELDGAGRVLKKSENDLADPNDITPYKYSTYTYDNAGRLISTNVPNPQTNAFGLVTYHHTYDSLGRKTCTTTPNGSGVAIVIAGRLITTREFGSDGGTCANPNGGTGNSPRGAKRVEADIFDRVSYVEEKVDDVQAFWAKTEYTYDNNNNIASIKRIEDETDPNAADVLTEMTHDFVGNRLEIDRHGRVWSYTYDRNGNMLTQTAPLGAAVATEYVTSRLYDALNRPTKRIAATGDLTILPGYSAESLGIGITDLEYDGGILGAATNSIGHLTKTELAVEDPSSPGTLVTFKTVTTQYDARGNVSSQTRDIDLSMSPLDIPLTDSLTSSVEQWNSFGQPLVATEASGQEITTHYVRSPSVPRHVIIRGANLNEHEWFINFRNAAGLVYRTQHFKRLNNVPKYGRNMFINRDNLGRVTREYSGDTGDNKIDQQFTFYGTSEIETHKSQVGPIANTRNFTYTYDDQHQLTSAWDDKGFYANRTYTRTGRLASVDVENNNPLPGSMLTPRKVDYEYNDADPEVLTALANVNPALPNVAYIGEFEHDSAGNLIKRDLSGNNGQVNNLIYDGDNRLRVRTLPDGTSETYFYADNIRWLTVKKNAQEVAIKATQWMGSTEVLYDCATGTCNRADERTTVALGGRSVARVETDIPTGNRDVKILHNNGLGHLLGVYEHSFVNNQLTYDLVAGFQYSPFGEILETTEALGSPSLDYRDRFNGKYLDLETGLSYYGHRYYDPLTQTWNRSDPLYRFTPEHALAEPRRGNVGSFALNNPLKYLDPDGLEPRVIFGPRTANGDGQKYIDAAREAFKLLEPNEKSYSAERRSFEDSFKGADFTGSDITFLIVPDDLTHKEQTSVFESTGLPSNEAQTQATMSPLGAGSDLAGLSEKGPGAILISERALRRGILVEVMKHELGLHNIGATARHNLSSKSLGYKEAIPGQTFLPSDIRGIRARWKKRTEKDELIKSFESGSGVFFKLRQQFGARVNLDCLHRGGSPKSCGLE